MVLAEPMSDQLIEFDQFRPIDNLVGNSDDHFDSCFDLEIDIFQLCWSNSWPVALESLD